jgi:tetratricopeptide (TPR) repeat protein
MTAKKTLLVGSCAVVALGLVVSTVMYFRAEQALTAAHAEAERQAGISKSANEFVYQGRYKEAEPLLINLQESRRRVLGEEHPDTLESIADLGLLYEHQGRYNEAEPLFVKVLEIRRRVLGEEHPDTLKSKAHLGMLYSMQGRYKEAEPLLVKALEIQRRALGEEHPDTLWSTHNLGRLYIMQIRFNEAEPLFVKALEIQRLVLGGEHPDTLKSMAHLGLVYSLQGRYNEAEPLLIKTLEIQRRVLGEEHPDTLSSMHNLGLLYSMQGRYNESEPLLVKVLEIQRRVLGEEHSEALWTMAQLGELYYNQGRYNEAEPLFVKALEIRRRVLGEEHPDTLPSMNRLGELYSRQGRSNEAEPLFVKALEISRRVVAEEHPYTLWSMSNLGWLYHNQGRYKEAEPLFVKMLEIRRRVLGEEHPDTLWSMSHLGGLYCMQGRYNEAEPLFVKVLEIRRRVLGEEHPDIVDCMQWLGVMYYNQGRYKEAEPLLVKAMEIRRRVLGEEHPDTLSSIRHLGELYCLQGRSSEAEPLFVKVLEIQRRMLGEEHPDIVDCMGWLGVLYYNQGRYKEAEPLLVKSLEISRRALGEEHPTTLLAMRHLGELYCFQNRYNEAEPLFIKALVGMRSVLGEKHRHTLDTRNYLTTLVEHLGSLGMEQYKAGAYELAVAMLKRVDEDRRTALKNESHPCEIAYIAMALHRLGRDEEAKPTLDRLRDLLKDERFTKDENAKTCLAEAEKLISSVTLLTVQTPSETDSMQAERLAKLKKCEPNSVSLALLPIQVEAKPNRLVADVLGLVVESCGMKNLDALDVEFAPPADSAWEQVPAILAEFLKKNPPKSEYVLYAQYLGTPDSGPIEVRFVVTDSGGNLVLTDRQTRQDEDFKRTAAADPDPMGCSALVAERLFLRLGWKKGEAEPHGKFAQKWAQMSGMPSDAEMAAMKQRLEKLKANVKTTQITIYATCIGDEHSTESVSRLVSLVAQRLGCKTITVDKPVSIQHQPTGNEQKLLWDLARAFRDYLRASPADSNYAMLAEYFINPAGGQMAGAVHFVVCEKSSDWVIVDFQNNQHEDFQRISPKSVEDCDRLIVVRLAKRLK